MRIHRSIVIAITMMIAFSIAGCSDRGSRSPEPSPTAQPEAAAAATEVETEASAPAQPRSEPEVPTAEEKAESASTEPDGETVTAATGSAPPSPPASESSAPEPAQPPAASPPATGATARIEVAATKPGLTRIGADKCKMCHKLQYDSWAASTHATQSPALDCESCHGPGSEYKMMAIMKDPDQAQAAGLVTPGKEFCVNCHQDNWSDDMIVRVHAHKKK